MKVVHIIKRIETIDTDIKELRKLEKSIKRNKSFSTPIVMSIEKQINILLGERVRLLELRIENPPVELVEQVEGSKEEVVDEVESEPTLKPKVSTKPKTVKKKVREKRDISLDNEMPMMTQDDIDSKFDNLQNQVTSTSLKADISEVEVKNEIEIENNIEDDSEVVMESNKSEKLLDIALEKGTLNRKDQSKERKVRFFRDNFPTK